MTDESHTDDALRESDRAVDARVLAGRYRVGELIGRGGMASVYRGYDQTLGRDVAIKILKRDLAGDTGFRTRFRLEAQAASRMANQAIVRVFDAGEDVAADANGERPIPFIVMELVHGTLLKEIIARGPVPPADAVRYVDGILEALEYSHRAGVVHRDIKPGNVMVTDAGQVKVMDFGIARAVSDTSSTVAETTTILGTAAYFSPEQAKGEPVDARADVYSTGIVLYELLTGRPPFRGDSPVAVAYQHVSEKPGTPSEVNESSPKAFDPVVLRALAKDPYQRFPDAASFRTALDAASDGKAPSKRELGALTSELYGANPRQAAETARSLRQLSTDNSTPRTQSGPPVAWIWAGVALLAVLVASVLFWVVSIPRPSGVPDTARIVPDVSGMTYERAVEDLESEDLVADQEGEPSDTVEEGVVIRTEPASGESVTPDSEVTVIVSEGVETIEVPQLEGLKEQDARTAIDEADLVLGSITPVNDASLESGMVMSAQVDGDDVSEGDEVAKGSTVNLTVASGRVTITDTQGFTLDAATQQLENQGLTVDVEEDDGCRASDPRTVSQQVQVGDVPVHSTVTLRVCAGDGSGD
ncbi:Stk1 family PASTA domain-containing Ser/Thr kinase [Microbacterium marinilacus]|uniref:non-specific serine/threonine protein kinase n=1 Tax=Microbacterium marinilacus TaxID=415209 RepID=A0ABP7BLA3_9MICO|nr:Stk1 family PASTA domain-containing Ser/Thr kinase [Microbacterium marinilacus]MBY0688410.1 Stk1 family PASTA domain-containing Ser/Thr kinase [Microbacterium marinilacus]